jgi:maltose alpha-D-glucosyltransferase/alpha-amylase
VSQIGRRAAEMHLALATPSDLADFAPEPIQPADVQRWIEAVAARAERIFDALKQQRDKINEADHPLVDQTLACRSTLQDRLTALLPAETSGLSIRQHGDFNLGRLLIVKDDIFITGFEGDLHRPLDERRCKAPAARDVASLIRSIDYSATAALERALRLAPDEHGRLAAALIEWVDRSTAVFLAAYREIMTNTPLWPADPKAAGQILEFFLLEKIFTELEYDLAQRPEWIRVPLTGVLRLLSQRTNEAS